MVKAGQRQANIGPGPAAAPACLSVAQEPKMALYFQRRHSKWLRVLPVSSVFTSQPSKPQIFTILQNRKQTHRLRKQIYSYQRGKGKGGWGGIN